MAQSGHPTVARQCPLLGVKRTSAAANPMSAFDPKRILPKRALRQRLLGIEREEVKTTRRPGNPETEFN
jgi:hypothetical protein